MKKFDVWFYSVLVEANNETEAIEKVNKALDKALVSCNGDIDWAILEGINVDYAEEMEG